MVEWSIDFRPGVASHVTSPKRTEEFLRAIGDPGEAVEELDQIKRSAEVLSSDHPRLIDEYPQRWVALHDGVVIADSDSLDQLLQRVDEIDPANRGRILVRFIDRHQQTMIL